MDNPGRKIKRFDQVKLLTTKNVYYLSAPPMSETTPHGVWSVVAAVNNDGMLAKDSTIIRIPAGDVLVVSDYCLERLNDVLGKLADG
jgi:hypothetical protein